MRRCRTCSLELPETQKYFSLSSLLGKLYYSKVCLKCTQKRRARRTKDNGTLKLRNRTTPESKKAAQGRDRSCIYPRCNVGAEFCDFDHAFSRPLEKLPKTVDWNAPEYGVMLCRVHHDFKKRSRSLHAYVQLILRRAYGGIVPCLEPLSEQEKCDISALEEELIQKDPLTPSQWQESMSRTKP